MAENHKIKSVAVLDAFTLLEMLIVLTIIGILMAIGMATYSRIQNTAMTKAVNAEVNQYKIAIYNYKIENGSSPASVDDLLNGGYITKDLAIDPWNTKYSISFNSQNGSVKIVSAGSDKKFGTKDDIINEANM